jgi:threonine synthase
LIVTTLLSGWLAGFPVLLDILVDVVLPTGAMGNMVAGYMAKRMGLPFGTFVSGVNINDITYRVTRTGHFHRSSVMLKTLSEAINIQLVS